MTMGVAGWRGGTTNLCPGRQRPSRRHCPVWSVFLPAEVSGQINSFLKRAHKYCFSNKIHSLAEITKEAVETLFFKMKCNQHCLNHTQSPLS